MKKTLALIVMLAAMLLCSTAFAGTLAPAYVDGTVDELAPTVTTDMTSGAIIDDHNDGIDTPLFEITDNGASYDLELYTYEYGRVTPGSAAYGLSGGIILNSVDMYLFPTAGDALRDEHDDSYCDGETTCYLVVRYMNAAGEEVVMGYQFYADWTNYLHGKYGFSVESFTSYTLPCWYPDNTANVFGPQAEGTWQTYAAVDLSVQGVQTFDLIAAGAWKIGTVIVNVAEDEVTVTCQMDEDQNTRDIWDDVRVDSEYLNIFADAASIDLSAASSFAFGQPISISGDLGGDTTVALVISNKVDYPAHSPYVTRFWPNLPENKALVEAMNALLAE